MNHDFARYLFALGSSLALLSGCQATSDLIGVDQRGVFGSGCPAIDCGGNSPATSLYSLPEFHHVPGTNAGLTNDDGVELIDFIAPGGVSGYAVTIDAGAITASKGADVLAGAEIVGSTFVFDGPDGTEQIYIYDYDTQLSWHNEDAIDIPRYVFSYVSPTDEEVPLCDQAETLSEDAAWVVLINDERYTGSKKAVYQTGSVAAGWVNVACHGNSLYKMKMMGYDPDPGSGAPFTTTWEQRQATIKMFAADYCGTGRSFTEIGHPLMWTNRAGTVDNYHLFTGVDTNEALWTKGGALCLDTPRLSTTGADLEELLIEIYDECDKAGVELPRCGEVAGGEEWITGNPE